MPCVASLIFDVAIGSCVREEEASDEARRCGGGEPGEEPTLKTIEGEFFNTFTKILITTRSPPH